MGEWRETALSDSPRRGAILLATAEHDNGWREVDAAPSIDPSTGALLDFVALPAPARQQIWPRGVDRLAGRPYAAALVAQHAIHVYARLRDDPAWRDFFPLMERMRDHHLAHADGASLDELLHDYQFVRVADLISLAFCAKWTEPQPDGFGRTVRLEGARVIVEPDPFAGSTVAFEIAGREIASTIFESAAAAACAWDEAPSRTLQGEAAGS